MNTANQDNNKKIRANDKKAAFSTRLFFIVIEDSITLFKLATTS
jgi:hypothetical protein